MCCFLIFIVFAARPLRRFLCDLQAMLNNLTEAHPRRIKLLVLLMVISSLCFIPDVTYCSSLVEIYGMPTRLGEELQDKEEREECAAYW